MNRLLLGVSIPLFAFFTQASAQTITVVTHEATLWAENQSEGFVPELFAQLTQGLTLDTELVVLPLRRMIYSIGDEQVSCVIGSNLNAVDLQQQTPLLKSLPISEGGMFIFSRRSEPIVNNVNQLKEASVAMSSGLEMLLSPEIRSNVRIELTEQSDMAYKMLMAKRVDYLIAFESTLLTELEWSVRYDKAFPLYTIDNRINCKDVPGAKALIQYVDDQLMEGHRTGQFDGIYQQNNKTIPLMYRQPQ